MKKISFLLLPLVAVSFLFSCSGNNYNDNCPYLTFNALEDSGATYKIFDSNDDVKVDVDIQYSTNKKTWNHWEKGQAVEIKKNKKIYIKNTKEHLSIDEENHVEFVLSGKIAASGKVSSLTAANKISKYEYCYLFNYCSSLVRAPALPATELAEFCYFGMFEYCYNLTKPPELPATQLADNCYNRMFNKCISLTKPPELPATQLADGCYVNMFMDCNNLKEAPKLPATQLADGCYAYMFYNCNNLKEAPKLPATQLADGCYNSMFYKCINLTKLPKLPATQLADNCYSSMFYNCINLTKPPELPATQLADGCYVNMFMDCNNLKEAPKLPATQLADGCYSYMFSGCTALKKLEVAFGPSWPTTNDATDGWLYDAGAGIENPTFIWKGPKDVTFARDNDHVPSNWIIEHAD